MARYRQMCPRLILKVRTSRLREAKWKLILPIDEAAANDELISVGSSQLLRWIDELNSEEDIDLRLKCVKGKIRELRKLPSTLSNRREIKVLRDKHEGLRYMPDYMHLIVETKSDYIRACKGFCINGTEYARLVGTNGGVKNKTIVFVAKRLADELRRRIENGRDETVKLIPAKYEAYRALTCSGTTPVSMPRGILVVNDCETEFYEDVIGLNDEGGEEPVMELKRGEKIKLDASDGYGLMLPTLAERWSKELGINYTSCGFNTRFSFEKGMVFAFDFIEFADSVAHKRIVEDAWGNEVDISDVELILTTSMLKLWDCYGSCEEYIDCCAKNRYSFGISKICPNALENERTLNYQFIQNFALDDNDISDLVEPTVTYIKDILVNDYRKSLLFLAGTHLTERNAWGEDKDCFTKAIMADSRVYEDPFIKHRIYRLIKKRIDDAKIGVIRVHANYSVVSGDPYALCQSIFGMDVTGLLKRGEIYNKYWADDGAERVVCFRAPMSCHNNVVVARPADGEEMRHWYRYMNTCTILNAWDTTMAALDGINNIVPYVGNDVRKNSVNL